MYSLNTQNATAIHICTSASKKHIYSVLTERFDSDSQVSRERAHSNEKSREIEAETKKIKGRERRKGIDELSEAREYKLAPNHTEKTSVNLRTLYDLVQRVSSRM